MHFVNNISYSNEPLGTNLKETHGTGGKCTVLEAHVQYAVRIAVHRHVSETAQNVNLHNIHTCSMNIECAGTGNVHVQYASAVCPKIFPTGSLDSLQKFSTPKLLLSTKIGSMGLAMHTITLPELHNGTILYTVFM